MPPSCQADTLTTKTLERWVPELQSFSPQGCVLKTVPRPAISQEVSQTAGGQGASLAGLTHAPLLCSEGTSSTPPPPSLPVGQLLVASCSARRIFASSCRGAQGCCSALRCGPPSIFFGSKTGLQESCSPPHFISTLQVAACHPLSCANTTAYEATPLSQVAEMPRGELGHKEGKELEEMG